MQHNMRLGTKRVGCSAPRQETEGGACGRFWRVKRKDLHAGPGWVCASRMT